MSWVTIIWSMVASACLTLAAIHFPIWCRNRAAWANLLFCLTAVGTAALAFCELWMLRAETPGQFGTALRWLQVPTWVIIVALVGFVLIHLRAGRPWLAWTTCGLQTFSLLLNFLVGQNLNYHEVTRLRHIPFFGESVPVAEGVSNPWMLVGQLSLLVFVVFVADAAIAVWRHGDRRAALIVGGSIVFFVLVGTVQSELVHWHIVHWPLTASFFSMGLVVVMNYELSRDVFRAAQLSANLRESEERYRNLFQRANDGIILLSDAGEMVSVNESFARMHGYSAEQMRHMNLKDLDTPETFQLFPARIRRLLDGEALTFEVEHYHQDGHVFPLEVSASLISSGGKSCIQCFHRDITGRKQAEELFRSVVEAAPNAMIIVNGEGRITLVNAQTEVLFGYTRSELMGQSIELLVPERFRSQHVADRHSYVAHARPRSMGMGPELHGRRKNGSQIPVEISLSPIRAAEGLLVLASIIDITGRKQSELEILQQRNELAHVGRVSTMGQLASALAHELNQPLGAILRNAEAAELFLQSRPPDLEEVRTILADIRKDDQRAGGIIDRMRALLKRRELERTPLDMAGLVDQVVPLVQPDAASRKVRLAIEVPRNLPLVQGDRVHLQQVLLNLILNGMDAMDEVPAEVRRLIVRARQTDAGAIEVAVADAGHGVPADKFARLFEPFFTTKPNGMGLGLPISSTIIQAHGGRIWAENGPAGATFFFTVPVMQEGSASRVQDSGLDPPNPEP